MSEIVVFFFPWKEISGGPYYLCNLANSLADDKNYQVWYADFTPGLSDDLITNPNVHKMLYEEPFVFPIKEPVTIIVPIYCASHIPRLPPRSKIVFLNWHNYCIQSLIDIWKVNEHDLQTFLSMAHDTHSVFFLDRAHWQAQNEWVKPINTYEFDEQYVPIIIESKPGQAKTELVDSSKVNIGVLGRLCRDKVWSVINLLDQLEQWNDPRPKNIHIIGDGEYFDMVANRKSLNNVRIIMRGTVTGSNLNELLTEQVDILFAMGRSVLESAALGLPSVVIPHNVAAFSIDKYAYLQNSTGYALGWYDTQVDKMGLQYASLEDVLSDIYNHHKKNELGQAALVYVKNNHFSNIDQLKAALCSSTLTYRIFRKFARKQGRIKLGIFTIARLQTTIDESSRWVSLFGNPNLFQVHVGPHGYKFLLFGKPTSRFLLQKKDGKFHIYLRIPFIRI